jgi:hypothetical protein
MKGNCVLCRKSSSSAHQYTLTSPFDLKLDQISIQVHVFEAIQKFSKIAMCNKVSFRSSELQMKVNRVLCSKSAAKRVGN